MPVRHDLPGVGGNLQDHLQLRMIYRVSNVETLNQRANSLWASWRWGSSSPCSGADR